MRTVYKPNENLLMSQGVKLTRMNSSGYVEDPRNITLFDPEKNTAIIFDMASPDKTIFQEDSASGTKYYAENESGQVEEIYPIAQETTLQKVMKDPKFIILGLTLLAKQGGYL